EAVWDAPLASEVWGSPALGHGHVYIGTMAGLRCVGGDLPPPSPLWTGGERGGIASGEAVPHDVEEAWRYPAEGRPAFHVTAPLMSLGEQVYAAGRSAAKPGEADKSAQPQLLKLSAAA